MKCPEYRIFRGKNCHLLHRRAQPSKGELEKVRETQGEKAWHRRSGVRETFFRKGSRKRGGTNTGDPELERKTITREPGKRVFLKQAIFNQESTSWSNM